MKLLIDTNAYSALLRGRSEVVDRARKAESVLISSIVAGELMFGFRNGNRVEENLDRFEALLNNRFVDWVPVTLTTADRLIRNNNPALSQQILDISKAQFEAMIELDRVADNFGGIAVAMVV